MSIEKLKEHGCRFCCHYDGEYCELPVNSCLYQYWGKNFRPKKKLPIAWKPHQDIKETLKYLCTRFAHECRLKGVVTNNDTCNLFDEWYPDIAAAIEERGETKLKEQTFKTERYHERVFAFFATSCCNYAILSDENYCPNCGRRINTTL